MTNQYLEASEYIDWQNPEVLAQARMLAETAADPRVTAGRCFEFVRDQIRHNLDHRLDVITCKASEVLHHRAGWCYAKSHLLAALLRANGIPAGLCYQRLRRDSEKKEYVLHGLNAIYLDGYGWYRVDAHGNKAGVQAEFTPPVERLAFPVSDPGEVDLPEIWPEPLPCVVRVLTQSATWQEARQNHPDIECWIKEPALEPLSGAEMMSRPRPDAFSHQFSSDAASLVEPTVELESEFRAMALEWREAGDDKFRDCFCNFAEYVQKLRKAKEPDGLPDGHVPGSTFWLVISDKRVIGTSRLRHWLAPHLQKEGGHIGYDIPPSQRRKGYGTKILTLTLLKARELGLTEVLITCDKDNIGSLRIIERNGGRKIGEVVSDRTGKLVCQYLISTGERLRS